MPVEPVYVVVEHRAHRDQRVALDRFELGAELRRHGGPYHVRRAADRAPLHALALGVDRLASLIAVLAIAVLAIARLAIAG